MSSSSGILDKHHWFDRLSAERPAAIELGCGANKSNADAIGIDALDFPGVDIVGDIFEVLARIPDKAVSGVFAYHFIEHIDDLGRLLKEIERVCATGARIELVAPHFSNPYFYSDPTHRRFFGLYTLCYFVQTDLFTRRVPTYGADFAFVIDRVDLVFKSASEFPVRYGIKKAFGLLFNSSNYAREFYEENLAHLIPCYEVRYGLRRA